MSPGTELDAIIEIGNRNDIKRHLRRWRAICKLHDGRHDEPWMKEWDDEAHALATILDEMWMVLERSESVTKVEARR